MAYQRVSTISYNGADDVSDLSDHGLLKKFKHESNLIIGDEDNPDSPIANVIDSMEEAAGYTSWEIERMSPTILKHTQVWESESDYDAWTVTWSDQGYDLAAGDEWDSDTLESAS